MNKTELAELARKAGFEVSEITGSIRSPSPLCGTELKRFAKLVAVAEREACAKVCYELPWKDMDHIPSNLAFAAAIRARGEK